MRSIRSVRRDFRKEVLQMISAGEGNLEKLMQLAAVTIGNEVSNSQLVRSFLHTELSNAVSQLRNEGEIETIGKQWKPAANLNESDVETISVRRLKRIAGELRSQLRLDHEHGRTESAIETADSLAVVMRHLRQHGVTVNDEVQDTAGVVRNAESA